MSRDADLPTQLHGALKSLQMYSASHDRTGAAIDELAVWLHRRLSERPVLHLSVVGGSLLQDGVPASEGTELLARELEHRGVAGLVFQRGIVARELREFLVALDLKPERLKDLGGLARVLEGRHCTHIQVSEAGLRVPAPAPAIAAVRAAVTSGPPIELDFDGPRPAPARPVPLPSPDPHPGTLPAPAPLPQPQAPLDIPLDARLEAEVRHGFLDQSPERAARLVGQLVEHGLHEAYFSAVEQLLVALEAPGLGRAAQGVAVLGVLAAPDAPTLPPGSPNLFMGALSSVILRNPDTALVESARSTLAAFIGCMARDGDAEGVEAQLRRMASPDEPAWELHRDHILRNPALVQPMLRSLAREGRGTLEGRALPFFQLLGETGARLLTKALAEEPSRQHRNRILEVLKGMGAPAIPSLRGCLGDSRWYLVRNALNLLGDLGDRGGLEAIRACLAHADVRVRRSAVRALWKAGGEAAGPILLEFLPRTDAETQVEALFGLGQTRFLGAIPAIAALASQAPDPLRSKALEALGRIGHPSAIPVLAEHLKRKGRVFKRAESPEVRLAAAQALAAIGTPEAQDILGRVIAEEPRGGDQDLLRKALESSTWR